MKSKKYFLIIFVLIIIVFGYFFFNYLVNQKCNVGEKVCLGKEVKSCSEFQILEKQYYCDNGCSNGTCIEKQPSIPIELGSIQKFSESYDIQRKLANISDTYLIETSYYDYSNIISNDSSRISLQSLKVLNPKEAVKEIAKMTYYDVKYNTSTQTLGYCYDIPASEILSRGSGVCSTMSRVNIAMLRSIGIASRQVSGCVKESVSCQVYSVVQEKKFKTPNRVIQEDRYVMGGYAHSWVEVWLPETGWTILESTSAELHPSSCLGYYYMANEDNYNSEVDECAMSFSKGKICDNF